MSTQENLEEEVAPVSAVVVVVVVVAQVMVDAMKGQQVQKVIPFCCYGEVMGFA
jgi:hypothetical protein